MSHYFIPVFGMLFGLVKWLNQSFAMKALLDRSLKSPFHTLMTLTNLLNVVTLFILHGPNFPMPHFFYRNLCKFLPTYNSYQQV